MGTWAEGNFDSDGALDYVGELMDSFVNRIEEILDSDGVSLDEEGESVLMPSVAILSLLCEHCGAAPPKENEIRRWRSKYLKVYDSEIDGLGPKNDFKSKRRQVIAQTFERLQQQSNEFWNRGK